MFVRSTTMRAMNGGHGQYGGACLTDSGWCLRHVLNRSPAGLYYLMVAGRFGTLRLPTGDRKVQVESYGGTSPNMVGQVVGDDSRGGWSRPWANSLRPLLLLSSPMEERERESLVYAFFSSRSTPHCEQQNDEVSEGVAFFSFFRITIHCICN